MAELRSMKNIGKSTDKKLKAVGISCAEANCFQLGSKESYFMLKLRKSRSLHCAFICIAGSN